jgi:anti-sigma regulatory factor (Ser/Thr protein kinase)/Fe-S-cluster-containing hydrogenase component 2
LSFTIAGGDYEQAGSASGSLKEQLKRIGVAADLIRRVMVAAYEAEMNVVIHANGGTMEAVLDKSRIDVEVADHGPGIPNIALAMTEGFSTAPPKAREFGFGAGLGLPNIRRASDRFTVESTVGVGTRIRFTIYLRPAEAPGTQPPVARNSLETKPLRCTECLACLHACPTRAMRLREHKPAVLDYLCVDCTSCLGACRFGALGVVGACETIHAAGDTVLVVSPPFVAQFGSNEPTRVLDVLKELGFGEVRLTAPDEAALRSALWAEASTCSDDRLPLLSPVCPAVVNLIATKFPSLLDHVAPFLSPMESVREELVGRRVVFLALCPSQATALADGRGPALADVILPATLAAAIRPQLPTSRRDLSGTTDRPSTVAVSPRVLRVTGMRHVLNVLEMIENRLIREPDVLELYACDEGCFGSPLLKEDAFVARRRWQQSIGAQPAAENSATQTTSARPRKIPLRARAGFRLDDDMGSAIRKLGEIDQVLSSLPGKDCGLCGCPTCATLAEDIVLGRSTAAACAHLGDDNGSKGNRRETP